LGFVLSGCCQQYGNIQDPFTIELVAFRDAMALARSKSFGRLVIETDCQAIFTMWNDEKANRSLGCHLFKDIKEMVGFFPGFQTSLRKEGGELSCSFMC
jgi:hypothetical protein